MLNEMPFDLLRVDDAYRVRKGYAQGGDLFEQFIRLIFPISGREKRTIFLPLPFWGKKKPQYKKFEWRKFQSAHFDFFAYPEGEEKLADVMRYMEEDHERNNRIFGVENRFIRRVPIIFYQSRRDFEQTHIISGPIPEGLGGVTELFSWRRVTFPFEGEAAALEHVTKHEGVHVYQVAKGVRRLPLWFIEGSAETLSTKWDAQAELTIRDAYLNGFFFPISELWRIMGTWLMYKEGNYITKVIWDEYGEEGFRKIFDRASGTSFDENIKKSLGITIKELDNKVAASLANDYGHLLEKKDLVDRSKKIDKHKSLLHAKGEFFVSGGQSGPSNALFLNHLSTKGKITRKKIVSDRSFRNESLDFFRKGAWISENEVTYGIKRSARDVIRIVPFAFDSKRRRFKFEKEEEYSWPRFQSLASPVLIGKSQMAFIGYEDGFTNIYLYDRKTKKLESLTEGKKHYSHLDYSPSRHELVFSQEDGATDERIKYDRNLYRLRLKDRVITRLTKTPNARESQPRFSPDGKHILYISDGAGTYNLYLYDLENQETRRISDLRIGVLRPAWGTKGTIMFNGFERLAPSIYRASLPDAYESLNVARPSGEPLSVTYTPEKEFVVEMAPEKKPSLVDGSIQSSAVEKQPTQRDEMTFKNGKGSIRFLGEPYEILRFARMGDRVLFQTKRGEPGSKKIQADRRAHYFEWSEDEIQSLDSQMVDRKIFHGELPEIVRLKLEGRPIIERWVSPGAGKKLILVNNELARDPDDESGSGSGGEKKKKKRKSEIGILIYDQKKNLVMEIDSGPLEEVEDRLQWVAFLAEDQVLFAVGEKGTGPFTLHTYDPKRKAYTELDHNVTSFRISKDRSTLAWQNVSRFYMRRVTDEKDWEVPGAMLNSGSVGAYQFLHDGSLQIFVGRATSLDLYSIVELRQTPRLKSIPRKEKWRILSASIDDIHGHLALRVELTQDKGNKEQILLLLSGQNELEPLGNGSVQYASLAFRRGYLTFSEHTPGKSHPKNWAWRDGQKALLDRLRLGSYVSDNESKRIDSREKIALLEGKSSLVYLDPKEFRVLEVGKETSGATSYNGTIIYSRFDKKRYQLFQYDPEDGRSEQLTIGDRSSVDPSVVGDKLYWSSLGEDGWILQERDLKGGGEIRDVPLAGYDLLDPKTEDGKLSVKAYKKRPRESFDKRPEPMDPFPAKVTGISARPNFRLQSLAAAAAFDGSDFRFFVSGYAENIFSDRGLFVNSVFLENAQFATVGYANLTKGRSYSFFYNNRDEIKNGGIDVAKHFVLDRYRIITLFSDFEIQDYGLSANADSMNLVTPDVETQTFFLVKAGAIYAYDVTVWDRHGPISGSRFYFKTEAGLDLGNGDLANVDANLDFRLYNRFAPRFGLAHRLVGGTSQGDLPNVFLLGGNISFRGVSFDDLEGQNYWVFSEDLRLPIFDFIGAKLFDPADLIFGFLTRYFDVRGGIYADMGQVWFNENKDPDFLWSVGYFVNVPTIFGFIFRLSQGFAGEDDINIWLGLNW